MARNLHPRDVEGRALSDAVYDTLGRHWVNGNGGVRTLFTEKGRVIAAVGKVNAIFFRREETGELVAARVHELSGRFEFGVPRDHGIDWPDVPTFSTALN